MEDIRKIQARLGDAVHPPDLEEPPQEQPKKRRRNFNVQSYMQDNLEDILEKLVWVIGEKGSAKHIETALKLMGLLVEKKEETLKFELTPSERIRIAEQFREALRRDFKTTGNCPVCGGCKILRNEIRMDPKSEHEQDREVATLAVSTRPD